MHYDFDEILQREGLQTAKWESEFARKGRRTLLSFGTADMDFRSAPQIVETLQNVAASGHFGYPHKPPSYYEAAVGYLSRHFSWDIQPDWIQASTGIYASIQPLLEELTSPGDEVVYQPPVHHIFEELVRANGRIPVANPLVLQDGRYRMDFEHLERCMGPRAKLLLLCSPHNPVGRVWTREELESLHALCLRREVAVIADEVYSGLLYPGNVFVPMASLSPEASMNTVTLISASKGFNLTGLKHSLVISENPAFRAAYLAGQRRSNLYFGGSVFGHVATEVAFRECDSWSRQLMEYVVGNFEFLREFSKQFLAPVTVHQPEATYFAWMNWRFMALGPSELVGFFEDEADVIVTSGHALGAVGDGYIRLNLACPRAVLAQGLERIRDALDMFRSRGRVLKAT